MIRTEIITMIEKIKKTSQPVSENSHLYQDLWIDSLTFVQFLQKIEELYQIQIHIFEMDDCLKVSQLLRLVEQKRYERNFDND